MKKTDMEFTGGIHGTIHILAKEEGLKEGRQEGLNEGRQKGQAELFLQMLALKFGELPEWILAKVKSASTDHIATYLKRCMNQSSLDEIFA